MLLANPRLCVIQSGWRRRHPARWVHPARRVHLARLVRPGRRVHPAGSPCSASTPCSAGTPGLAGTPGSVGTARRYTRLGGYSCSAGTPCSAGTAHLNPCRDSLIEVSAMTDLVRGCGRTSLKAWLPPYSAYYMARAKSRAPTMHRTRARAQLDDEHLFLVICPPTPLVWRLCAEVL